MEPEYRGGVDSFYSLYTSLNQDSPNYRITHGCNFETESFDEKIAIPLRKNSSEICSENQIEFVNVCSNIIPEIYPYIHEAIVSYLFMSYVLSMQKLFSVFYFSSAYSYADFSIKAYSSESYELLNVHLFSTENTTFYTTGSETIRNEKTNYIADFDTVQRHLMVCRNVSAVNGRAKNCSRCSKCTRTMIDLDIHNKLDSFHDTFDVDYYNKHKLYFWGYLFYKGKDDSYTKETLDTAKSLKKSIPFGARLSGAIKILKHGFKRSNPQKYSFRP